VNLLCCQVVRYSYIFMNHDTDQYKRCYAALCTCFVVREAVRCRRRVCLRILCDERSCCLDDCGVRTEISVELDEASSGPLCHQELEVVVRVTVDERVDRLVWVTAACEERRNTIEGGGRERKRERRRETGMFLQGSDARLCRLLSLAL